MECCCNCLNAYNANDHKVHCVNLAFDKQFDSSVSTVVKRDQHCSRFTKRRSDQSKLIFNSVIQLDLFGYDY